MSPKSRRTVAASCILALASAWLVSLSFEANGVKSETAVSSLPPTSPMVPKLGRAEDYAAISAHPLFSPTRAPQAPRIAPTAPPIAASPAPIPALSAIVLLGVAIGPDSKAAIVRLANGTTSSIKEGETIDGWRLSRILVDHVTFEFSGSEKNLFFPAAKDNPSKAPRRAAPPRPH